MPSADGNRLYSDFYTNALDRNVTTIFCDHVRKVLKIGRVLGVRELSGITADLCHLFANPRPNTLVCNVLNILCREFINPFSESWLTQRAVLRGLGIEPGVDGLFVQSSGHLFRHSM